MGKLSKKINSKFQDVQAPYDICYLETPCSPLRYIETGNKSADTAILFIHGAPGSLDAFLPYLVDDKLRSKSFLISVDRPGYGGSNHGKEIPSIYKQAQALKSILTQHPHKKFILVGHSFGAPIAAYLAAIAAPQVKDLVLMGAAVDPIHEKFIWSANMARAIPFRWIVPKSLLVASEEKVNHRRELEEMKNIWYDIDAKVHVVHGKKDWIVPHANIKFLQNMLKGKNYTIYPLEEEGHLFLFTKPAILQNILLGI